MITSLYQKLIIPGFETCWKGRKTSHYWKELEKSQWFSSDQLRQNQLESLQKLVSHAFQHCEYYQDRWKVLGISPEDLQTHEDFAKWPIIGRKEIREHREQMRADLPNFKLIAKSTGGSSGVPLQFDLDEDANDRRNAAWHRGYSWAGAEPGTKQLYVWGVPLGDVPTWKRWKLKLYDRVLYRRRVLNTFDMCEETIPEFYRVHNAYKPKVIVAYTNPLYQFARSLHERGWKPYAPQSIVVGAEKLHDFQRELIEDVFQAPIFETYGSREFTLIGAECEHHAGFHLTTENLLVEIRNDDGTPTPNGEEGNIVITDLTNYGMPFVRYANGDRAIAGFTQCQCGRGLPLMKKVAGRQLDILHTPDGHHVPGEFFPHLLKDYPTINRFQVVQEVLHRIDLKLVVSKEWSTETEQELRSIIRHTAGDEVELAFHLVEEIPLTKAGKMQVVVNRCAPPEMVLTN